VDSELIKALATAAEQSLAVSAAGLIERGRTSKRDGGTRPPAGTRVLRPMPGQSTNARIHSWTRHPSKRWRVKIGSSRY